MSAFKEILFVVIFGIVGIVVMAALGSIGHGNFFGQLKAVAFMLPIAVFSILFSIIGGVLIEKKVAGEASTIGGAIGFLIGLFVITPIAITAANNLFK